MRGQPWPFIVTSSHQSGDLLIPISQLCSIATKSVSPAIVEIMSPKYRPIGGYDLDLSGSCDVISLQYDSISDTVSHTRSVDLLKIDLEIQYYNLGNTF